MEKSAYLEYQRQYRMKNKEKLREYFAAHYQANRVEARAYNRDYYADHSKQISQQKRHYYLQNREKIAAKRKIVPKKKRSAQSAVQQALVMGRLVRPAQCVQCHAICKPDAHHHKGYDRKLDVLWLCRKCHFREHHS